MSLFFQKIQRLLSRNLWITSGLSLALLASTCFAIYHFKTPSKEITKAELETMIQAKTMKDGLITPTPYPGIYSVEARRQVKGHTEII